MLDRLFAAARADAEDQIGWAAAQAKGQAGHVIYLGVLAVLALAALIGAVTVGLVGLHAWLTALYGPLVAYLALGLGLLALSLLLLLTIRLSRRPKLAPPPSPRLAQPATLDQRRLALQSRHGRSGGRRRQRACGGTGRGQRAQRFLAR